MTSREYKKVIFAALLIVLAFIIGVLIGYFSRVVWFHTDERTKILDKLNRAADTSISKKIFDNIDAKELDKNLRKLTEHPRLAGDRYNTDAAYYVHQEFLKYGLESEIEEYNVTLSYPDKVEDNYVAVVSKDGSEVFRSTVTIEGDKVPPYNAYSPSGDVQGQLVFANYGRERDFQLLKEKSINCSGAIVIARYGKAFRGNKVDNAFKAGAIGIILYSDPADYAQYRYISGTYPDSIFLPEDGAQRGNIVLNKGDQSTPGYPATEYAYRMSDKDLKERLPQIPCLPISYGNAYNLLRYISGDQVPKAWEGGLNITYRYGGRTENPFNVKLKVSNRLEFRIIYNVIGKITGDIEPDRYVIIGNHRDAWVYGSVDPTSGSITLMEMARVFGKLLQEGWRPRRTLLFCSWDAEEFGLVGSYEWVEDNVKWLISNAVAYINIDSSVSGNETINLQTVPLLQKIFEQAAKKVADPHGKFNSVYDAWINHKLHRVKQIGGGSDHVPFVTKTGIPSVYTKYFGVTNIWTGTVSPLYHTRFEDYNAFKQIDPEMRFSVTITAILSEMTRNLADSTVIPFDIIFYAEYIRSSVDELSAKYGQFLGSKPVEYLKKSSMEFYEACIQFRSHMNTTNGDNPLETRQLNDKLMWLERSFLVEEGLPGNNAFKHVLHSPGTVDYYAGVSFPGLSGIEQCFTSNSSDCREEIQKHVAGVTHCIYAAAKVLAG